MDFSAPDADTTIISSDNVTFKIHSANLCTHSNVFHSMYSTDSSQPAHFGEHSDILKVLLAWIYPDDPPDPEDLPYTTLLDLAHAAHKYQIGSLILVCDIRIFERGAVRQKEPIETFKYALRYARKQADLCAQETIMVPAVEMVGKLDTADYIEWTLYRERCLDLWLRHVGVSSSKQKKPLFVEVQTWIKWHVIDSGYIPFGQTANRT